MMNLIVLLAIFCLSITSGYGERTKDKMYQLFDGKASCFRRLNGTHQTGCSSKRGGSIGILHFVDVDSDLAFILKNGNAGDYMPVVPTRLLNVDLVDQLINSTVVSGLMLYNATDEPVPSHYSHDSVCTNSDSNVKGTCTEENRWNPAGTGLLWRDLPFPIYYVENDDDLKKMRDCFNKFNNFSYETQYTRSLCNVELDSFMYAAGDTPTCLRRSKSYGKINMIKVCDPLGERNIWASLFPLNKNANMEKFIVVAARLDSTSMFNGVYPGAVSVVSGLVKLLATVDLLKRMVNPPNINMRHKNVLFVLFNGESYDYIGSQRLVYDMEKGTFPQPADESVKFPMSTIELKDIYLFVELSQLTVSEAVYVHQSNKRVNQIDQFVSKLSKYKGELKLSTNVSKPLPPGSVHSFLRANDRLPAVTLADYNSHYTNRYFNSIYDNLTNINYQYYNVTNNPDDQIEFPINSIQQHTVDFSQMLANALYEEITTIEYQGNEAPRKDLIDELYYCYLSNPDCKVHQAVMRKRSRENLKRTASLYVGVKGSISSLTSAVGLTIGWLIGDIDRKKTICVNDSDTPMYQYLNMSESLDNLNTTVCFRTTMNFAEAISPAFLIDDYDWSSGNYSSWAESTWKDLGVRMFLKPSPAHERFTLAIGCVTLIMSLILVYFIKSRSHILFAIPENCSPTNC